MRPGSASMPTDHSGVRGPGWPAPPPCRPPGSSPRSPVAPRRRGHQVLIQPDRIRPAGRRHDGHPVDRQLRRDLLRQHHVPPVGQKVRNSRSPSTPPVGRAVALPGRLAAWPGLVADRWAPCGPGRGRLRCTHGRSAGSPGRGWVRGPPRGGDRGRSGARSAPERSTRSLGSSRRAVVPPGAARSRFWPCLVASSPQTRKGHGGPRRAADPHARPRRCGEGTGQACGRGALRDMRSAPSRSARSARGRGREFRSTRLGAV